MDSETDEKTDGESSDRYPTGKSGGNRVGRGLGVWRGARPAAETLDPGLVYSEYSE